MKRNSLFALTAREAVERGNKISIMVVQFARTPLPNSEGLILCCRVAGLFPKARSHASRHFVRFPITFP